MHEDEDDLLLGDDEDDEEDKDKVMSINGLRLNFNGLLWKKLFLYFFI